MVRDNRKKRYKFISLVALAAIVLQIIYPIIPFLPSFKLFKKNVVTANDNILATGDTEKVMFENTNPEFKVEFGNKEQQDKPFVRFQALGSGDNPFDKAKNDQIKENIFERLQSSILGEKQHGIEFSMESAATEIPSGPTQETDKQEAKDNTQLTIDSNNTAALPSKNEDTAAAADNTPADTADQSVLEAQAELQAEEQIYNQLNDQLDAMIKGEINVKEKLPEGQELEKYREQLKQRILDQLTKEQPVKAPTQTASIEDPNDKTRKEDIIKNPDVVPNVDAQYRIMEEQGLKEQIVIKNNDGFSKDCVQKEIENANNGQPGDTQCSLPKNTFTFSLKLDPGVQMKHAIGATNQEPHGITYFTDEKGKYLFHFLPLFAVDGKGVRTNAVRLEIDPGSDQQTYTMKVVLDLQWLLSPERQFPITIDPSIVHDTKAEFDAGNALNRVESLADPKVDINHPEGGNDTYTKLLLHADGADASTTFTDSSMPLAQHKTVTPNGDAKIATAQSKFGGTSAYFDGNEDYLSIPDSTDWNFDINTSWSVDFWAYPVNSFSSNVLYGRSADDSLAGGENYLSYQTVSAPNGLSWGPINSEWDTGKTLSLNQWQHVAMIYDAGFKTAYACVDGSCTSVAVSTVGSSSGSLKIGDNYNASFFNGYIDEFRISKGIARWTSNFTPPTKPYDFKKPYGEYDSSVLDLTSGVQSIDSLQWTENGVRTGDGSTPYSTTNLVAQWNFNKTSGVAVDNSDGTCGSACDLTLSGYSNTASQDATPMSGWTADNKRWGAGGLMTQNDTYTKLLLHTDGTNNSTVFSDSEPGTAKTITPNGDAKISTTQSEFGGSSAYFDGSGDYLSPPASNDWQFGTGDFTIDMWVYRTVSGASQHLIGQRSQGAPGSANAYWNLIIKDTNVLAFRDHGGYTEVASSGTIPTNTWTHVSAVRLSGTVYLYINGTQDGSGVYATNMTYTDIPYIGQNVATGSSWNYTGYIDELRISKGIARWTGNFTPPTRPYYASAADPASNALDPNSSDMSVETWIKTNNVSSEILSNNSANGTACTANGYYLGIDSSGYPTFNLDTNGATAGCYASVTGNAKLNDGNWHHLAVTVTIGTGATMWLDGASIGTGASVTSYSGVTVAGDFFLGTTGIILDSTRIYSRALTANEVLSNSETGNIEFETRTGADNTPDDGSWEAWKPTTSETQIDSMDSDSANWDGAQDSYTKLLLHADGANNSTQFPDKSLFTKAVTTNGNAVVSTTQSEFGGSSAYFDGTGDYLSIPDSDDWAFGTGDFTVDAWVRFAAFPVNGYLAPVFCQRVDGSNLTYFAFYNIGGTYYWYIENNGAIVSQQTAAVSLDTWYHIAFVRTGNTFKIFQNGTQVGTDASYSSAFSNLAIQLEIGKYGASHFLTGYIDELRISKGIARWTANFTPPSAAYFNPGMIQASDAANPKAEGSGSMKTTLGAPSAATGDTVGLWHMEETGGSGAYIKDSTANANNGTPTGTTLVDGIYGKARNFDGSNDVINMGSGASLDFGNNGPFTISGWIKPTSLVDYATFVEKQNTGLTFPFVFITAFMANGRLSAHNGGSWSDVCPAGSVVNGNWQHVAFVYNGTNIYGYVNGATCGNVAFSYTDNTSYEVTMGSQTANQTDYDYNGIMDEVKITKIARSADEIAEDYRLGRDWRLSRTIASTDFSSKTKLPFWVAGDRVGTYLEATAGESDYANYMPDSNTMGLWHLEEAAGSGAYLKDSSGYANNGTPTGTTYVDGKIGKARLFDDSDDYIAVSDSASLDIAAGGNGTVEAWVKPNAIEADNWFLCKNSNYCLGIDASGNFLFTGASAQNDGTGMLKAGQWYHLAVTDNGTTATYYINGQAVATDSVDWGSTYTNELRIGRDGGANYFDGYIDEARVSNTARTADQIRQAFEVGKRTHPITIDFQAKLDAGNLIANSGDTSFTVDDTSYLPTTNKADTLYIGDKVIVKENYDGTEYLAQGTVDSVNVSTGAATVSAWDAGSTFPAGGFTVNATVFKWQKEWVDVTAPLGSQVDAVTRLTLRCTDGSEGRNVYLDDFRSGGPYLTNPAATSNVTSTVQRYMQYRAILSTTSSDLGLTPYLSGVTVNYTAGPNTDQLMRHGRWFSGNVIQPFWWAQ